MSQNFDTLTPEELVSKVIDGPPGTTDKVHEVLAKKDARFIQRFMHRFAPQGSMGHWFQYAKIALDIRIAEEAAETAEKLAQHTGKLTQQTEVLIAESKGLSKLTRDLKWLTIALGVFAVVQIILMVFDIWKHK